MRRHLAQTRPFAIVPGMNHAQFSNGVLNTARGDVASEVPIETQAGAQLPGSCVWHGSSEWAGPPFHANLLGTASRRVLLFWPIKLKPLVHPMGLQWCLVLKLNPADPALRAISNAPAAAVAGLVRAFIAANHPGASAEAARRAVDQLLQATTTSFGLLSPCCEAAGRGCLTTMLVGTPGGDGPAAAAVAYAFGAERLPAMNPARGSVLHPGESAAAERFCRCAQARLLTVGLPAGGYGAAVRVAVTVHCQLDTFIYSQPMVFQTELPDGQASCWQR